MHGSGPVHVHQTPFTLGTGRRPRPRARRDGTQRKGTMTGRTESRTSVSVDRSLTDDQRSRPASSSEHTHLAELRALGSTGSSSGVALADGPEPDELADFGSALVPGRRSSRPNGLFVADGGSQCPEGPYCAAGSATSCGEAGCSSARRRRPRLSLGFPRVPFLFLRGVCWGEGGGTQAAETRHSRRSETCGDGSG